MEQNKDQSGAAVRGEVVADGGWNVLYDKNTESDHYVKYGDALAAARRLAQGGRFDVRIVAADAPSEPSEQALWDDNGEPMNDAAEKEWRQCNERIRQRAADALDSQPTVLAYVATDLDGRADVGMTPEKAMERAGHGCDTIIPVYDLASSQPTDGGVRNG